MVLTFHSVLIIYCIFFNFEQKVAPVIWLGMDVIWIAVVTLIVAQQINKHLQNAKIQISSMFSPLFFLFCELP